MSLGDITGPIAAITTAEHRDRFGQTLFGTLLGQTLVCLGMIAAYVATLAFLYRNFRDDLTGLREWAGELPFWAIILAPLAFILAFSLVPTAVRGWRGRDSAA